MRPFQSSNLKLSNEIMRFELHTEFENVLVVQERTSSETVRVGIYKTAHTIICPKLLSKRK